LEGDDAVETTWDYGVGETDESFHAVKIKYAGRVENSSSVDVPDMLI
jgi:hypothetical protein